MEEGGTEVPDGGGEFAGLVDVLVKVDVYGGKGED